MSMEDSEHRVMLTTVLGLLSCFAIVNSIVTFRYPNAFLQALTSIFLGGLVSYLVSFYFFRRQEKSSEEKEKSREKQFTDIINRYRDVIEKLDDQAVQRGNEFKEQILYMTRLSRFRRFLETNKNWNFRLDQIEPEFQFLNHDLATEYINITQKSFHNLRAYSLKGMKSAKLLNREVSVITRVCPGEGFKIFLNTMQFNPDGIILAWEQSDEGSKQHVIRTQILRFDPNLSMRRYFSPEYYGYDLSGLFINKEITLPGDLVEAANKNSRSEEEKIKYSIDQEFSWIINYYALYKEAQRNGEEDGYISPELLTRSELEEYVKQCFGREYGQMPLHDRD
ncbi:hypothetical protein [Corynebacterium sp.]|uniref:hypothetical protein n=1 Tax=Corynebacterium sp. TaxID=1720 RepID=UPI0028AE52AE|nr:hypothetical protein [Corynebacterium sp.]